MLRMLRETYIEQIQKIQEKIQNIQKNNQKKNHQEFDGFKIAGY